MRGSGNLNFAIAADDAGIGKPVTLGWNIFRCSVSIIMYLVDVSKGSDEKMYTAKVPRVCEHSWEAVYFVWFLKISKEHRLFH